MKKTCPHDLVEDHSCREGRSCDDGVPSYETGSMTSLRRNALNPDDECQLPDTKRHKKTSVVKLQYPSKKFCFVISCNRAQSRMPVLKPVYLGICLASMFRMRKLLKEIEDLNQGTELQ
ncbi:hypothetical protein ANCDUO_14193 [Ancylostoma duodenale]|uniref:Uncharacterized protein n=1 Tax=Ancylostoma duodenale TaxID=51022 RepID=A0A0C2G9R9_9BILA|nr:hypothetical protein ANCDUO_14193 [Ancylostoma duodenale]